MPAENLEYVGCDLGGRRALCIIINKRRILLVE